MKKKQFGFSLLELMVAMAIIAVLGAVAVIGYQEYTARARASEIVLQYDALRTKSLSRVSLGMVDDCDRLASALSENVPVSSQHVALGYGFEAASGGYRPVLTVCAQADPQYPLAVKVARGVHDTMARTGDTVSPGAVLLDSVVSFSLRLTDGDRAICKTAAPAAASTCASRTTTPVSDNPVAGVSAPSSPEPVISTSNAPVSGAEPSVAASEKSSAPVAPAVGSTGGPVVSTAAPNTQSVIAVASNPPPPNKVLVCGDLRQGIPCSDMELVLADLTQCPPDKPFAMNEIQQVGTDIVQYRYCASHDECTAKVTDASGPGNPLCANFDPGNAQARLTCNLCCYGEGCNVDTNPPQSTLWKSDQPTGWTPITQHE